MALLATWAFVLSASRCHLDVASWGRVWSDLSLQTILLAAPCRVVRGMYLGSGEVRAEAATAFLAVEGA